MFDYWDRRSYIGSHESGIVLGDSKKYKSLRRLHEEKRGRMDMANLDDVIQVQAGLYCEDFILDNYEKNLAPTHRLVRNYIDFDPDVAFKRSPSKAVNTLDKEVPDAYHNKLHLEHKAHPYIRCSPDALVLDINSGRLVKAPDAKMVFSWDKCALIQSNALPMEFEAQGRHFCKMTGLAQWDFHCWLVGAHGAPFKTLTYYDNEISGVTTPTFLDEMGKFWQDVKDGNAPAPDGTEMGDAPGIIKAGMDESTVGVREATDHEIDLVHHALKQDLIKKEAEGEFRAVGIKLADGMGADTKKLTVDGQQLVTRRVDGGMIYGTKPRAQVAALALQSGGKA